MLLHKELLLHRQQVLLLNLGFLRGRSLARSNVHMHGGTCGIACIRRCAAATAAIHRARLLGSRPGHGKGLFSKAQAALCVDRVQRRAGGLVRHELNEG